MTSINEAALHHLSVKQRSILPSATFPEFVKAVILQHKPAEKRIFLTLFLSDKMIATISLICTKFAKKLI